MVPRLVVLLAAACGRLASAAAGTDVMCVGDRPHVITYEIDGEALEEVENATVSVRPAPEMNGVCDGGALGAHKLFCVGANADASCAQAQQALAFNNFVECTNCFAGATADLVFDMKVSLLKLKELRIGVQDIHLRGALEVGSSACASEAIASGSVTIADPEAKFHFLAGPVPVTIRVGLPASVDYTIGVDGSFQALAGAAVDINLGDHYVEWTRSEGFKTVMQSPSVTVNPISPSVFVNAGGDVELALHGSLQIEVDKVAWYHLDVTQDLPVKVNVDMDSAEVCVDSSYDFAVQHEADVHFRLFGNDHDVYHLGPADLHHVHKDDVIHKCVQHFATTSPPPGNGSMPSHRFGDEELQVLPHCTDGEQHGWPKFKNIDQLMRSPWANYFKHIYGEVPTSGYPICTFSLSHLYKPALLSAGVALPEIDEHCPTKVGQYYSRMTDHQDSWSTWIWNPNLAQPSVGGLPSDHWVEIIHQSYYMDGDAAWMYYTPGTAIWFNLGSTKVYDDHDDAVRDLLSEACEGGGGWGPFDKECVPQFPRLYSAAIVAGLNSMQFLKHADMVCGMEQDRRNMAIEIVDLGGPGTTTCGKLTSGKNRYRGGWEARHDCNCDNCQGTVNCQGFGINGSPSGLRAVLV